MLCLVFSYSGPMFPKPAIKKLMLLNKRKTRSPLPEKILGCIGFDINLGLLMKAHLTLIAVLLLFTTAVAQSPQTAYLKCLTEDIWERMAAKNPGIQQQRTTADELLQQQSSLLQPNNANPQAPASGKKQANQGIGAEEITTVIPTVIYIVHDGTAASNISMTQIQSQMDQLNNTFADYGYSFCYARRNVLDTTWFVPQSGDSAGVFRINNPALSDLDEYTEDVALKSLSALPSQNYLRIFVVSNISPAGTGGYAFYPGTSNLLDGIVIRADLFGSNTYCPGCQLMPNYNLGAALIHEAGHYLNLYHTFQGGCYTGTNLGACQQYGDRICDTPPTTGSFGCPNPAPLSCNGVDTVRIDNYMDYTDDPCKHSFTAGQKARMDYSVLAYRGVLVSTANLINTGVNCIAIGNSYAEFDSDNFNGCVNYSMKFKSLASPGFVYSWNFGDGTTATGDTVQHTYSAAGTYLVTLNAQHSGQNINVSKSRQVIVTACAPIACEYTKWAGEFTFLDFASGTPVASNHPLFPGNPTFPGFFNSLARNDSAGNPLFYIGAQTHSHSYIQSAPLFDNNFNAVDSFALADYYSASLLLPVPDKPNTYCFIQNYETYDSVLGGNRDTVAYSIITMQNGVPVIKPGKKWLKVPVPPVVFFTSFYNFAGIPSCDSKSFWIIASGPVTGTVPTQACLAVLKLDSSETISVQSTAITGTRYYSSSASPNGKKVAFRSDSAGLLGVTVFDFDNVTGQLSNGQTLLKHSFNAIINSIVSFSPNSRFIYAEDKAGTDDSGVSSIYQFDLNSPNPALSKRIIGQYPFAYQSVWIPQHHFQLGPDKKMYIGTGLNPGNSAGSYRLGVISYPDLLEDGTRNTGYNPYGPSIKPANALNQINSSGFGFFTDRVDAFGCDWEPGKPQHFSYKNVNCLTYKFMADDCYTAIWNFGDTASGAGNNSTLTSAQHSFTQAGVYVVSVNSGGYLFTDTIRISKPQLQLANTNVTACPSPHGNYSLAFTEPNIAYHWQVNNGIPQTAYNTDNINVQWNNGDTTGSITLIAADTAYGCADTAIFAIHFSASEAHINYSSATICKGGSYLYHGQLLTTAGSYVDTYTDAAGCDSTTVFVLNIKTADTTAQHVTICNGEAYPFNGVQLSNSGTYYDTLSNVYGCDSLIYLQLSVDALNVSWSGGNDTVNLSSGGITLNGGTPPGGTYSGNGVTNNVFFPANAGGNTSIITYSYTDSAGCTSTATKTFVITGVNEIADDDLLIYPNPATEGITVEGTLVGSPLFTAELFTITGQLVQTVQKQSANKLSIEVGALPSGVYCLSIIAGGANKVYRIVKL